MTRNSIGRGTMALALLLAPGLAAAQPPPAPFGQPAPAPQPPVPPPGQPQPPPFAPQPSPVPPPAPAPAPSPAQPAPQYPPPSGGWAPQQPQPAPFAWATPVPPAGSEETETSKGVRKDLPLGRRGAVALDTASMTLGSGQLTAVSIDVVTNMPVAKTTFLDATIPLGWATDKRTSAVVGNIMLGAHHVLRRRSVWWILGGAIGLPLLSSRSQDDNGFEALAAPRALWNLHEVAADSMPIELEGGLEAHFGDALLRFELDPVFYIPIGRNDQPELAIQHAAEIQYGHAIGGGFRIQGVALPTFHKTGTRSITEGDLYQLAIEPFFVVERRLGFLRLGLVLPMDEFLGPPLSGDSSGAGAWGLRFTTGIRLE